MTIQQHASFDSSAAELNATSKLVKAWESKNAKNAAKVGGISLMALSLAACGGSSTTTTTTTTTETETATAVAGKVFVLNSTSDVLAPNATAAANQTTAGDDTFRAGSDGDLTSSDYIDGGDGTDTLTATVAEGSAAVTIKPSLTSVETFNVTMAAITADTVTTFDFGDATGLNSFTVTNINDADVSVANASLDTSVTFAGVAGVAADSVLVLGMAGLTTATTANGGGADAYTVNLDDLDAASLTLAGVEVVTINLSGKAVDVDAIDMDGLESLIITGGVNDASVTTEVAALGSSAASANSAFDFEGLDTGETASIDASDSTGAISIVVDDSVDLTVTGGAGKLTIANTSAGAAAVTGTANVTVTAGAGGIDATLEGGSNTSTTAMNTITVTGSAVADTVDVTGAVAPTDNTTTIALENNLVNVTLDLGAGNDVISANLGNVDIDAGAGDDSLTMTGISATELNSLDTIDMGAGEDTVVTGDGTLNVSDDAQFDRISNAEIVNTTSVADKVVDLTAISSFSAVEITAHTAQSVGASATSAGTDGADGVDLTSNNANSRVIINDVALVGEVGGVSIDAAGASGGDGGIGLDVGVAVDNGANTLTIEMIDAASIAGGAGGSGFSAGGGSGIAGDGGIGVAAETLDIVNIVLVENDGTADTVTFAGGVAGAGSAAGEAGTTSNVGIAVATNATINITEEVGSAAAALASKASAVNLNEVTGNNVTIDASAITGNLTLDKTTGNVTVSTGSGDDTITTGTGVDTISAGAGDDTIDAQTGADVITGGLGNDAFVIADGDSAEATYKSITDFTTVGGSWTGSAATDTVAEFQSTNGAGTSVDADILDLDHSTAITIEANTTVAQASADSTANVTYSVSNGIVTLGGSGASGIDTLAKWVDEVEDIVTAAHQVAAFEFNGNTYVYMEDTTDAVIELTGLTGVAGIDILANSGTVGGDGYIIIA